MAGLGRKVFTRERATVADVQGYLMDQTIMRFPSASAANAAISAPSEGMHRYLDDVNRLEFYTGAAWVPLLGRTIPRTVSISGGGGVIIAGGSVETGVSPGIAALANFTLYRPSWVSFDATFRAGGAGAALCSVKIDGATVGNVAVSRNDGTVPVGGAVSLAAGVHTVAMRVDTSGGGVTWTDGRVTIRDGAAE